MRRVGTGLLAGLLAIATVLPAAAAPPETAAAPFPIVPLPPSSHTRHRAAWACLTAGAGLVGVSFVVHDRANRRYSDYLASNDPSRLDDLYDQTTRLDHWSTAALIGGEVVFATGVYLRFLRETPAAHVSFAIEGTTCVARWRF